MMESSLPMKAEGVKTKSAVPFCRSLLAGDGACHEVGAD